MSRPYATSEKRLATLQRMDEEIQALRAENAEQRKRIAELEAEVNEYHPVYPSETATHSQEGE